MTEHATDLFEAVEAHLPADVRPRRHRNRLSLLGPTGSTVWLYRESEGAFGVIADHHVTYDGPTLVALKVRLGLSESSDPNSFALTIAVYLLAALSLSEGMDLTRTVTRSSARTSTRASASPEPAGDDDRA